jgi:hypothetical protein
VSFIPRKQWQKPYYQLPDEYLRPNKTKFTLVELVFSCFGSCPSEVILKENFNSNHKLIISPHRMYANNIWIKYGTQMLRKTHWKPVSSLETIKIYMNFWASNTIMASSSEDNFFSSRNFQSELQYLTGAYDKATIRIVFSSKADFLCASAHQWWKFFNFRREMIAAGILEDHSVFLTHYKCDNDWKLTLRQPNLSYLKLRITRAH